MFEFTYNLILFYNIKKYLDFNVITTVIYWN